MANIAIEEQLHLPVITAFAQLWTKNADPEKTAKRAHYMALTIRNSAVIGYQQSAARAPTDAPADTAWALVIAEEFKSSLRKISREIGNKVEYERRGLGGGYNKQHDLEKLLQTLGNTGDRNLATETARDIAKCLCLSAQETNKGTRRLLDDLAAGWATFIEDIRASQIDCGGGSSTGKGLASDGEEDEEEYEVMASP